MGSYIIEIQKIKMKVLTHLYHFKLQLVQFNNKTHLLKIIQFLLIMIIIIRQNILRYLKQIISQSIFQQINSICENIIFTNHLIMGILIIVPIIIIIQTLHIKLCQIQLRITKFEHYSHKLLYSILVLYFILGIIQIPTLYQIGKLYSINGNIANFILIILNIIPYWPFTIIGSQYSPFLVQLCVNIYLPSIGFIQSNYKYFLIIIPSFIFSLLKNNRLQKVAYLMITLISLWTFIDKQLLILYTNIGQQKLLLLSICSLLLAFIVFKSTTKCLIDINKTKNQQVFKLIEKSQTQKLIDSNPFETVFNAWQNCMTFHQSASICKRQYHNIRNKNINQLTKSDLVKSLMFHIENVLQSQKDISYRILYLKLKIIQNAKLIQIIYQIQNLMSISNKKNITIKNQYQLLQFSKYVEDKLFLKGDKHLKTSIIIQRAILSQQFYSIAADCFHKLIAFWQFVIRPNKSKKQIVDYFDHINQADYSLRQKFNQLSKITQCKQQRKLMIEIQNILNGHSIKSQFTKTATHDNIQGLQKQDLQSQNVFILLQGNKIIKTSFQFFNDFNLSEQQCYEADKSLIFGDIFNQYFEQQQRKVTIQNRRVFVMPVFNKYGQIMVKNCSIYIYPQLKGQVKYLVSFSSLNKTSQYSLVVYSTKSDSIEMVNKTFIDQFRLNRKKIQKKINQSKLLSNQIFSKVDLSSNDSRQFLKQQKPINCELIVKNFNDNINSKIDKHMINMRLITQFEVHNDILYMLQIKRGSFVKTQITLTDIVDNEDYEQIQDKNNNFKQLYKHQTFFCKINNSYCIKITEKQSQISQPNRKNYIFYLQTIFIFVIILTSSQIAIFYTQSNTRITSISQYQTLLYKQTAEYVQIQNMYILFFQLQYFKEYPQALKLINPNISLNQVKELYLNEMSIIGTDFLDTYLTSLKHSKQQLIGYSIKFDYFQIDTDTSKSTLIDFSQKFSLYIKTQQSTFLFENYIGFRQLAKNFQNTELSQDTLISIIDESLLTIYSLIVILITLLIMSCFLSIMIQYSINQVFRLLQLIEQQDSLQALNKIQSVKNNIKQMSSLRFKKQQQSQLSKYSTLKIIQFSHQLQQKSHKKLINTFKSKLGSYIDDQIKNQQLQPLKQPTSSNISHHQYNKSSNITHHQQIQNDPIVLTIIRNSYYLIIIAIFGSLFYIQMNFITQQQDIFSQLFSYQRDLVQSQIVVAKLTNDYLFKAQQNQILTSTYFRYQDQYDTQDLHAYIYLDGRQEFKDYNPQQFSLLFSDICDNPAKYMFQFQNLDCLKVAGGILSDGLSQTFSMYFKLTNQLKKIQLQNFVQEGCQNGFCPVFIEAFYLKIQLKDLIQDHIAKFRQFFYLIESRQNELNEHNLYISYGLVFGLMIGFVMWIRFLGYRCSRAIKMFQIIPPQIMKRMKMTNFIRKNNILSRLNVL